MARDPHGGDRDLERSIRERYAAMGVPARGHKRAIKALRAAERELGAAGDLPVLGGPIGRAPGPPLRVVRPRGRWFRRVAVAAGLAGILALAVDQLGRGVVAPAPGPGPRPAASAPAGPALAEGAADRNPADLDAHAGSGQLAGDPEAEPDDVRRGVGDLIPGVTAPVKPAAGD